MVRKRMEVVVAYLLEVTEGICCRNPTWWRRRTSMERNMTILAAVAWCVVTGLIIVLAIFMMRSRQGQYRLSPSLSNRATSQTRVEE
jgi:hypothetical protein